MVLSAWTTASDGVPLGAERTSRSRHASRALHEQGCNVFLEIGPRPALIDIGRSVVTDPEALWLRKPRTRALGLAADLGDPGRSL